MTTNMATARAEFDGKGFFIKESSANIRQPPSDGFPLLTYLNILSQTGWKAVRGRFDGWTVIFELERHEEDPENIAGYMLLLLNQTLEPEELLSTAADFQTKLFDELQEIRMKEGWEIVVGPKHLWRRSEMWAVSLWVKDSKSTQK